MVRTRKRDDDSQYSDATSLAALDASSMSATGSRGSLTFASSTKAMNGKKRRPKKRRRKSLTDALQSISLDKDKGVPEQILSRVANKVGDFPFSNTTTVATTNATNGKSVAFSSIVTNRNRNANGSISPIFGSASSGPSNYSGYLNSKQQADRQIDRENGENDGDGDIYYDDDNSQLTSSTEEQDRAEGMEDDDFDIDDEDDDEDSQREKLALLTDLEKAQRKVMLELVFGKDHRESRKAKAKAPKPMGKFSSFSGPREVSSCVGPPPSLIVDPMTSSSSSSPPPPFATISTTTMSSATLTTNYAQATTLPTPASASTAAPDDENETSYKDPVDRKIEELLRRSLKNLREGSHPLQLPKTKTEDDDSFLSTPWKTQDDMAIDPQIYSPRGQQQQQQNRLQLPLDHSMVLDSQSGSNLPPTSTTKAQHNSAPRQAQARPFARQRSNSLPGGLDMMETTTAMDMDG